MEKRISEEKGDKHFQRAQKQRAIVMVNLYPDAHLGCLQSCPKAAYTWKKPQICVIILMSNVK